MNIRTEQAIENMVRLRSALKEVDMLHCDQSWILETSPGSDPSEHTCGVVYEDRNSLMRQLSSCIKKCEDIVKVTRL